MKAVVLAGGRGLRLYPLTTTINKHIINVGKAPMIWYPLWSLKQAGFDEALIITDRKDAGDIVGICGSGKDLGMDLTYRFQDQAGGVAEALGLAKSYVGDESFISILGDNVFSYSLRDLIIEDDPNCGCCIVSTYVDDPLRYALLQFDPRFHNEVLHIHEKPKHEISNQALTGIAIFDYKAFDFIDNLHPSSRNELEYTDVLNMYIDTDDLHNVSINGGLWVDAGTFSGLDRAQELVARENIVPFPHIKRDNL